MDFKKHIQFNLPNNVGSLFNVARIYLFKNKVHALKKYHRMRKVKARELNSPSFSLSTTLGFRVRGCKLSPWERASFFSVTPSIFILVQYLEKDPNNGPPLTARNHQMQLRDRILTVGSTTCSVIKQLSIYFFKL